MEVKGILSFLGVFLKISGFLSLLPTLVSIYYGEPYTQFLVSAIPAVVVGYFLAKLPRTKLGLADSMVLASVTLLVVSFFGALSYFVTFEGTPAQVLVDGYFESISGYTTTGFTVLPSWKLDPASPGYHHGLVFKRALSQWTGGLGVIVIFLSILVGGGISTVYLYRTGACIEKITPKVGHTARIIVRVALFYTLAGVILLWITGMDLFYALNAALSSVSTGGFTYASDGLHANAINKLLMVLLMMAGAIPFTLHYRLFEGGPKKFLPNIEVKTLIWLIASFSVITVLLVYAAGIGLLNLLTNSIFNVVSTITTTGFSTWSVEDWGGLTDVGKLFFIVLMVFGGGAGSTAGGLKLIRVYVLVMAVIWIVRKFSMPQTAVVPFKVGGAVFKKNEVINITLFVFAYITLMLLGAMLIAIFGVGLDGGNVRTIDALFLSTSALGTVSQTTLPVATQPLVVKIILIMQMILGRLEVIPLLVLADESYLMIRRKLIKGK